MDKLQKRIREVEEEHAGELLDSRLAIHQDQQRANALLLLGRIQATDRISAALHSEVLRALEQVEETKAYKALGYDRFVDYLGDASMSPITKSQFYEGKKVIDKEGDVVFNALNCLGIPLSKRKSLGKGNIQIEGDQVIIKDGDEETFIQISDRSQLIEMLTVLADRKVIDTEVVELKDKKIEDLQSKIKTGAAEYDELRRSIDAAGNGTPYEQALMKAIGAMIGLAIEANKLPLAVTQTRGLGDVQALWSQMLLVRAALQQPNFVFSEPLNTHTSQISDLAKEALANDDDWGDEYEQ